MSGAADIWDALKRGDADAAERLAAADPDLLSRRGAAGVTPLLFAAYLRRPDLVATLRPLKPDLDLYEAAALGDRDRLAQLLEADPSGLDRAAPDGFSPLGLAAFFGQGEAVRLLLARGADANQPSANAMRVRPIHSAVAARSREIAQALLDHGAEPNARQQGGHTPLHAAAHHGDANLALLLLGHGADPRMADDQGADAIAHAVRGGHADLAELMRHLPPPSTRPVGLLCAIPEEIAHFGAHFAEAEAETIAGFVFRRGRLDGRPTVLVEAGIGKVNAAVVATLLLERFGCRALLFSGVAGGLDPELGIGDVVVATRLVQHDYGAVFQGQIRVFQPGVPPMPGFDDRHGYTLDYGLETRVRTAVAGLDLPPMPATATGGATRTPRIVFGTVITGDQYVNDETLRCNLFERFTAAAVEMEGAAIAQVAERYGAPCLVIRSLSDLAGNDSHMDFYAFAHAAAAGAAQLLRRVAAVV